MQSVILNLDNVKKVHSYVRWLLQGLHMLPEYSRIDLLEQATALEQLAYEFRMQAGDDGKKSQD